MTINFTSQNPEVTISNSEKLLGTVRAESLQQLLDELQITCKYTDKFDSSEQGTLTLSTCYEVIEVNIHKNRIDFISFRKNWK